MAFRLVAELVVDNHGPPPVIFGNGDDRRRIVFYAASGDANMERRSGPADQLQVRGQHVREELQDDGQVRLLTTAGSGIGTSSTDHSRELPYH